MLYRIMDGSVSLGGEEILSHIDFEIKGNEKIGLVGRNGAGKTTFLRLLIGELSLDRDDKRQGNGILKSRELTVGYLQQTLSVSLDTTLEAYMLQSFLGSDSFSRERFAYEMEFDKLLCGFGFSKEDKQRALGTFSGGEQTKLSLIHLLLEKPDILLLDEPTNHLDVDSIEWLEEYIRQYPSAVIFVSHDRFFLDQVVEVIYELEDKKMTKYVGTYTAYRIKKQQNYEKQKKAYESQQAEIARLNELILSFRNKPSKAAFARSRKSILERMERIDEPRQDMAHIFTGKLEPKELGAKWVYEAEHLKIGYDKVLLELSWKLRRGQKIGIIGPNGIGKSTFLKTLIGQVPSLEGKSELGNRIDIGYFDQQTARISLEETVLGYFQARFPAMLEKDIRKLLGCYLFRGTDVMKKVSELSGGEKARLILAEILTQGHNFLVLDEPTNHMDIPAKETLESAFQAYQGTLLFISHDRYFISEVADAILVFEKEGVSYYPFGYKHYLERLKRQDEYGITAMISAENQALVADLQAVPKAERHETRQLSTDEAYVEWRLSLAAQPLQGARDAYLEALALWSQVEECEQIKDYLMWMERNGVSIAGSDMAELLGFAPSVLEGSFDFEKESIQQDYLKKEGRWLEACMDYWELFEELK